MKDKNGKKFTFNSSNVPFLWEKTQRELNVAKIFWKLPRGNGYPVQEFLLERAFVTELKSEEVTPASKDFNWKLVYRGLKTFYTDVITPKSIAKFLDKK